MVVGAQHCPLGLHALWGLRDVGVVGGRPRGGWPATVVRGLWCQALSLPRPPVLWGGQPGFRDPCVPGAVGAGVGTQHRPHQHAPLRAGVARRGGGGRASSGRVPSAVVRGVWGQALLLPLLPALWAGCRGSLATCCGRGCGCVRCAWCLCGACRGAWCRFSLPPLVLPSPVLRCGVVPAVCRVHAVPPSLRASLARLLATPCFVRGFVALFPFLCSPFSLACTFSLPPPWCVPLCFSSPAFSLVAPCEGKGMVGVCGPSSCIVNTTFVAASRRITYLPSHLCLQVCARSSPFVPYHGVLMSFFPYPPPFVCCLSWCRCTLYAKETCVGGGPLSYSSPCSLVGPTPSLVSVGGAGRALVAPLVCAAGHDMISYLRRSLLTLLIFSCDACLAAVMLLAWV